MSLQAKANSIACLRSHIKAVETAKSNKLKSVLIFEDDVRLANGFKKYMEIVFKALPDDWDAVWLNGTLNKPNKPFNYALEKVTNSAGAFAYILRESVYDSWLAELKREEEHSDGVYSRLHKFYNVFMPKVKFVFHEDGWSVREERIVSYSHINKR